MDKQKRPGIILYFDDIRPAMDAMEDSHFGALVRALVEYAETGKELPLEPMEKLIFSMYRPKIDRDDERYHESQMKKKYATYCREMKKFDDDDRKPLPYEMWKTIQEAEGARETHDNK